MRNDYAPDLSKWPARLAEIRTRVRTRLGNGDGLLVVRPFLEELLATQGLLTFNDAIRTDKLKVAETEYLLFAALLELEVRGEIWPTGPRVGLSTSALLEALAWTEPNSHGIEISGVYRPAPRLFLREGSTEWVSLDLLWENVVDLVREAGEANDLGLHIAAAATARVAIEEAVERALETLGVPSQDNDKAWQREQALFELIKNPKPFRPLDREATRAAISAIRNNGNSAAHDGAIAHPLAHESLMRLLTQAVTSLSNAVKAMKPEVV